jgi:hypothetical protein
MKTTTTLTRGRGMWFNIVFALAFLFMGLQVSAQQVTGVVTETWQSSNWVNFNRTINTYDSSGYLTISISQTWNGSAWVNSLRSNYANNPNGTVNQMVAQTWNTVSSTWEDLYRISYTYNAAGKVLTSTSENWTALLSSWTPTVRTLNTYDGSGYLVNDQLQIWDFISSSWQNYQQTTYTNNGGGLVTQAVAQTWNGAAYENSSRTTYTYNAGGKPTLIIGEIWNGTAWDNSMRDTYDYDAGNHLTHTLSQEWDTATATYLNTTQENYTNNADGSVHQLVAQEWVNAAWVNAYRLTFTYAPLAVSQFEHNIVIAYPNPAQNFIRFRANGSLAERNYTITDVTGKSFLSGQMTEDDMAIDVNQLQAGIYFVRFEKLQPIKIIKQ